MRRAGKLDSAQVRNNFRSLEKKVTEMCRIQAYPEAILIFLDIMKMLLNLVVYYKTHLEKFVHGTCAVMVPKKLYFALNLWPWFFWVAACEDIEIMCRIPTSFERWTHSDSSVAYMMFLFTISYGKLIFSNPYIRLPFCSPWLMYFVVLILVFSWKIDPPQLSCRMCRDIIDKVLSFCSQLWHWTLHHSTTLSHHTLPLKLHGSLHN